MDMCWRDLLLKLKIILKFSLVRHAQRQRLLENEIKPALLYVQQSRMISLLNTSCYDNKKIRVWWFTELINKSHFKTSFKHIEIIRIFSLFRSDETHLLCYAKAESKQN